MPPVSIMIKPVSSACNMRCKYCFYEDVSKHRKQYSLGRMTEGTLENIVRRALRYATDSATFAFQGGEPTLAGIDFYKKLVSYQKMYNTKGLALYNSIQTNGYDISDEFIEFLKKENFLVGVSLDAVPHLHDSLRVDTQGEGTHRRVTDTLRRLERAGVQFNVLCVVNNYIAQEPEAVFKALAKYKYIQYIPCLDGLDGEKRPWSLDEELYASFLNTSFDLYYQAFMSGNYVSIRNFDNYIGILLGQAPENCGMCGRCAQNWLIEANGAVYPCDFYVLDDWCLGNINAESFHKLAKSPVQERFMSMSLHTDEKCRTCQWFSLCRGGCRRDREPFTEGIPALNKHCEAYLDFFEHSYPKMTKVAEAIRLRNEK